jgi:hypothetical protein
MGTVDSSGDDEEEGKDEGDCGPEKFALGVGPILGMLAALGGTAGGTAAATAEEGPHPQEDDEWHQKHSHKNTHVDRAASYHRHRASSVAASCLVDQ